MTPLRRRMVEDMKIRDLSPETRYRYIKAIEKFAQHFGRSPELLGREEVREFLVCLHETGASYAVISNYISALRFLYRVTLRRDWTCVAAFSEWFVRPVGNPVTRSVQGDR